MDQTIVDLTELLRDGIKISVDQEVVVIDNVSDKPNSVESLAVQLRTIPNEILTKLTHRITRVSV